MEVLFKTLSDQSRLRILSLLLDGQMCVCEIEAGLRLTQSNVSRHLSYLKKSGILDYYKRAQWKYYKINNNFIQENKELWNYLVKKLKRLPTYKKDYAEYQKCRKSNLCNKNIKVEEEM